MSEQSLREALKAFRAKLDDLAGPPREFSDDVHGLREEARTDTYQYAERMLADLLAAHPAGPAPVVTDEAVEAAARGMRPIIFEDREQPHGDLVERHRDEARRHARAALEAAVPLLGPRPLLDSGAVYEAIADELDGEGVVSYGLAPKLAARVADLVQPMPTREQIEQRIRRIYIDGGAHITHAQDAAAEIATAVLALINGSAK